MKCCVITFFFSVDKETFALMFVHISFELQKWVNFFCKFTLKRKRKQKLKAFYREAFNIYFEIN